MYGRQYRDVTKCILMLTLHLFPSLRSDVHMLFCNTTILTVLSFYLYVCIWPFKDESVRVL